MASLRRRRWNFAEVAAAVFAAVVVAGAAAGDSRGARHAFAALANGRIALVDSMSELISVNPDGSGRRVLAQCRGSGSTGCPIRAMEWSPDGTRLLFFRRDRAAAAMYSLFVADAGGRGVRRLASCGYCGLMF